MIVPVVIIIIFGLTLLHFDQSLRNDGPYELIMLYLKVFLLTCQSIIHRQLVSVELDRFSHRMLCLPLQVGHHSFVIPLFITFLEITERSLGFKMGVLTTRKLRHRLNH